MKMYQQQVRYFRAYTIPKYSVRRIIMSDSQKHEQRRFAIDGIKNTGFYYTKSLVDGKYKLPILYCLQLDGSTRYNELQRKMETATFRSLSKALKELEADGLIIRKDYGEIPPRVEYSLSERGKSLEPVLDAFCLWGQEHRND